VLAPDPLCGQRCDEACTGNGSALPTRTLDDVGNLLRIFSDPEARRYYPATKDREETVQWVDWNVKSYGEHGYGLWAAIRKDTMSFAGQCGLVMQRDVDESDEVEIGYSFVRAHWNSGFATEAAIACRDFGFRDLNLGHLVSLIHPDIPRDTTKGGH
jgi:RimJ/RimL family protein N-acetyltransferase